LVTIDGYWIFINKNITEILGFTIFWFYSC